MCMRGLRLCVTGQPIKPTKEVLPVINCVLAILF
jgi:hypothetical protein